MYSELYPVIEFHCSIDLTGVEDCEVGDVGDAVVSTASVIQTTRHYFLHYHRMHKGNIHVVTNWRTIT